MSVLVSANNGLVEYPDDFATATFIFTTTTGAGVPTAPSSALEAADVKIYKNGSGTERTSESGYTMTSPFDSHTGTHMLIVDLSDNTDAGFFAAGAVYDVFLDPDETVDGLAVNEPIGKFWIRAAEATAGVPDVNVVEWLDTAVTAGTAGIPNVDVTRINDSAGAATYLSYWMAGGVAGTSDSGTTTTMVDAARTNADDHWNGGLIIFVSGTNINRARIVTDFDAASDTFTFTPALPDAITTEVYVIIPWAGPLLNDLGYAQSDLKEIQGGAVPTPNTTGVPDVNVFEWKDGAIPAQNVTGVPEVDVTYWGGSDRSIEGFSRYWRYDRGGWYGGSDSGSTTTMVDASLSGYGEWVGYDIIFVSGTNAQRRFSVTGYDEGTTTITFAPASADAVTTESYIMVPSTGGSINDQGYAQSDLKEVQGGAVPTPNTTGVPDVNVFEWKDGAIPAQNVTGVPEVDVTYQVGGLVPTPNTTGVPDVNVDEISRDGAAADNLELMYDGTGYTDDTAPASRLQVSNLGASSGGSINFPVTEDNTGGAIDPSSAAFVGSVQGATTFANTEAIDGTVHNIDDVGDDIDIVYGFDIGGSRIATAVTFTGDVDGNADEMILKVYDHDGADWETIGTIEGSGGSATVQIDAPLFLKHSSGTAAEVGKVYIRIETDSTTPSNLSVDQLVVSAVSSQATIGYVGGAVWIDTALSNTNTESYVDGTADNPVSTLAAARTLMSNLNIKVLHSVPGTTFVLASNSDKLEFIGANFTVDLSGESIEGCLFSGASISGIGVATVTQPVFDHCEIGAATIPPAHLDHCGIGVGDGQFTAGSAGQYVFHDCYSVVAGSGTPDLVFSGLGATTGINNRAWKGGAAYTLDGDCTLSHEVLAGGGTTITTAGGDAEIRGICRSLTVTMNGTETVQFVGITGPITLSGTTTATVNLYGISASVADSTSGATVTDLTVNGTDQAAILADTGELQTDWTNAGRLDTILDTINTSTADLGALVSATGTADSGTAVTLVDAALTQADNYWNGAILVITNGTLAGQARRVVDFDAASNTLSFDTFTAAVATHTYALLPDGVLAGSSLTADAVANKVWDEAQVDHTGVGTMGLLASEIAAILVDTSTTLDNYVDDLETNLGTPSNLGGGATISDNLADMAGATFNAATDALEEIRDRVETVYDDTNELQGDLVNGGRLDLILDTIAAAVGGLSGASMRGTDSAALASVATEARLAELGAANLPADIDAINAKTTNLPTDPADQSLVIAATDALLAAINALNDVSTAQVNAQVVDALATDTYAEPGQGNPPATTNLANKIAYLYKMARNKKTQTSSEFDLYNDAGDTIDQKSTVTDDATTHTRGELVSGP